MPCLLSVQVSGLKTEPLSKTGEEENDKKNGEENADEEDGPIPQDKVRAAAPIRLGDDLVLVSSRRLMILCRELDLSPPPPQPACRTRAVRACAVQAHRSRDSSPSHTSRRCRRPRQRRR